MSIIQKIKDHEYVYKIQDKKVPPYRITYQEHIDLVDECMNLFEFPNNCNDAKQRYGFIASYIGVEIEVVTIIY